MEIRKIAVADDHTIFGLGIDNNMYKWSLSNAKWMPVGNFTNADPHFTTETD